MRKKMGVGFALTAAVYVLLLRILIAAEAPYAQSSIRSFGDALWYSLVTMTTVGYGDLYPVSPAGRSIGAIFLLLSVGCLALVLGAAYQLICGRYQPMLTLFVKRNRTWFLFSELNSAADALAGNLAREYPDSVQVFCGIAENVSGTDRRSGRVFLNAGISEALDLPGAKAQERIVFLISENDLRNSDEAFTLRGRGVRIYCCGDESKNLPDVSCFQPYDCCARKYWQEHPVGANERCILLVGSGKYAQALLSCGMMINCRAPLYASQYHLFGEWNDYFRRHHRLSRAVSWNDKGEGTDSLHIHSLPWNDDAELVERTDRIIFCSDDEDENARWAMELERYYAHHASVYIRTAHQSAPGIRFGQARELYTPELIMKMELDRLARQIHERYRRHTLKSVPEWEKLDAFLRESNRAAADHVATKIRLLLQEDADVDADACQRAAARYKETFAQQKEVYRQMEHERWLRFYRLHNWRYGEVRNDEKRVHPCVVPYAQLSEEERAKDDYAWLLIEALAAEAEMKE